MSFAPMRVLSGGAVGSVTVRFAVAAAVLMRTNWPGAAVQFAVWRTVGIGSGGGGAAPAACVPLGWMSVAVVSRASPLPPDAALLTQKSAPVAPPDPVGGATGPSQ